MRVAFVFAICLLLMVKAPPARACPWLLAPTGKAFGDFFGTAVAGGGDVNKDGYADFLVGNFNHGRAFVFFGGPDADEAADLVLIHFSSVGDGFGASLAMLGDLNGDGADDFGVGASASFPGAADKPGEVYVYFGGADVGGDPGLVLNGPPGEWFGYSLAGAGDVNGDGFSDFIVGAPAPPTTATLPGSAYLYLGGPGLDDQPDLVLAGENVADRFGFSVASAGDVNQDGFDDLIVGAFGNNAEGIETGRAYLFLGAADPDSVPDLVMTGARQADFFGVAVSGAGDLNGDNFDDFMVAATIPGTEGKVHVFFGGETPDGEPDVLIKGFEGDGRLGESLASVGDVNRDGSDDALIGAIRGFGAEGRHGKAYLFLGGAAMDSLPDKVFVGQHRDDGFGGAVAGAGDVDGDGFPDLLVGASGNEAAGASTGRAYLFTGNLNLNTPPRLTLSAVRGPKSIDLSWSLCPAEDYTRVEVRRRTSTVSWATISTRDGAIELGFFLDNQVREKTAYEYQLVATGGQGEVRSAVVSIDSPPAHDSFLSIAPNPLRTGASIRFFMAEAGPAHLDVYDALGRHVRRIAEEEFPFGESTVAWDGLGDDGVAMRSGVYVVSFRTDDGEDYRRIVVHGR